MRVGEDCGTGFSKVCWAMHLCEAQKNRAFYLPCMDGPVLYFIFLRNCVMISGVCGVSGCKVLVQDEDAGFDGGEFG